MIRTSSAVSGMQAEIRTARLRLRKWRADDAVSLLPILHANVIHLADWIPAAVATPAPLPELEQRLLGYAVDFEADRAWRFAIRSADLRDLFGEVSLFPRSATGRTELARADRAEIGYWLREDVTGRGYATEAAAAMLAVAGGLPRMIHVEIRCDARNTASAAVPKRLGFTLSRMEPPHDTGSGHMIWIRRLEGAGAAPG